jgi:hypothetical protein
VEVAPEGASPPIEAVLCVDTPPAPREPGRWYALARLEARTLVLLPRGGAGGAEGLAQLAPTVVVDDGEKWGLHVGAPVRVRLWGGEARAGRVRREDWDSLSDWGHLVRRYSNRAHPDYHPAGGYLMSTMGPLYVEAFTSDVLGARLVGAQAEVDLAHVLSGPLREQGCYTLGLSAVRDWGRAGGLSPQVTLAHVDGTAVVMVRPGFELLPLTAFEMNGPPSRTPLALDPFG